ncbi:hypothetical protein LHJ74_22625 [Streptomyces sp. N2-109]|uniref:Integral membrane protein n=1 Tax=Streptomyces gossypii TaxID=2883101 RepID=A0ABT2JXP7_9ACTN|nr:hypothetical protein [Streptomyces gossypii]MCT2592672.1 hypothetical protein [Streptomyces gossypii]
MAFLQRMSRNARVTLGNACSLVYLGLVAAAMVFAAVDTAFVDHADASLSGVWMLLLTLPTVLVALGADFDGPLIFGWVAAAALFQAGLIGLFVWSLRRAGSSRTPRSSGTPASSAS